MDETKFWALIESAWKVVGGKAKARGFIVAAGQAYYDAVNKKPSIAMMDLECEDLCYLSHRMYREKFGEAPDSKSSRESCQNKAGWPDLD
jgi:hypothetical protein